MVDEDSLKKRLPILGIVGYSLCFSHDIALALAGQDVKVDDAVLGDFHDV